MFDLLNIYIIKNKGVLYMYFSKNILVFEFVVFGNVCPSILHKQAPPANHKPKYIILTHPTKCFTHFRLRKTKLRKFLKIY